MTTRVEFEFYDPDGAAYPNKPFVIKLANAGFIEEQDGVVLPNTIYAVTDEFGKAIVEIMPTSTPYFVHVPSDEISYNDCCVPDLARFKFYVPVTDELVQAQDLFIEVPPSTTAYDEEAIRLITEAKVTAVNAATQSKASADRAEEMAQSIEGDANMARESAIAALASENSASESALSASQSADSALQNKNATDVSAAAALESQNAAKTSETNAKSSETNAATSLTNAANSATAAATSATNASNSAIAANTSAGTATKKAGEAVASANAAASSASTANTKAGEASASAVAAKTSETNAKTSETNAANSATNASTAGSTAGTAAANAVVVNKQDKHINLTAFSGLTGIADRLPYFTGDGALSLSVLTAKARLLIARTDTAGMQAELALIPVTSNVDNTAGRLLTVGSFGTGGLLPRMEANTIDALRDSGSFYLTAANGPGTTPGGIGVGYLSSIVYAATYAIQWFYTSDSATTYRRVLANNVWGTWFKQDFGTGIVLGNALPSGNANQELPSGKYFVQTVWTGSPFTGTDNKNRGYVEVSSWGQAGYQLQEFTPLFYAAANPRMFRTNVGGSWGAWYAIPVGNVAARDSVTSGELLAVGHSGWNGGVAIVVGNGADCNTLVSAHMYALNGTYTNGPTFFNNTPFFLRVLVHGPGYETQEAICITAGFKATRRRVNSVWGEWLPDINTFTLTSDPASGAGGVVYSGSNANGSYIKFADGTMICTGVGVVQTTSSAIGTSGLFFSPTNPYATFPVAFVGTVPRVTYSAIEQTAAFSWVSNDAGASLTQVTSRLISTSVSATAKVTYVAIGRWK